MGSRGPIKKTAAAEKLAGNPGKRVRRKPPAEVAISCDAPAPPPPLIDCPEWLAGVAREEWHRAQPELREPLRPAEIPAFTCYCQSYADLQWAHVTLEAEGRTVELPNGIKTAHPALKIAAAAMARIKAFASEFGLTPASRARVPEPKPDKSKDALGEFLADAP